MEIAKLKYLSKLADSHDQAVAIIKDLKADYDKSIHGSSTITIPRSWLPGIIGIAEAELSKIEGEIEKL